MQFLYPSFLWALSALAIPLLIHLFNFRKHKVVYFSNTRFLQNVQKNTRAINRLRQWVILLSRMLMIAALVLAFAQPFRPGDKASAGAGENLYLSLYLDNSFSMKIDGSQGPLLNEARERAAQLLEGLPQNARIQVLSNSFDSRHQRFYHKDLALELIDQIEESPAFRDFEALQNRIDDAWQSAEAPDSARLEVFLFSDFQKSSLGSITQSNWPPQGNLNIVALKPANPPENIAIDSLWFAKPVFQPGFEQELRVRLRNYGERVRNNVSLSLTLNEEIAARNTTDIPAQSTTTLSIPFEPAQKGHYVGKLSIDKGKPGFDNQYYFSFSTQAPARVTATGTALPRKMLERLYGDSLFRYQDRAIKNLNYTALSEQDLVIIQTGTPPTSGLLQSLRRGLEEGNNLMLVPGDEPQVLQQFLQAFTASAAPPTLRRDTQRIGKVYEDDPYFDQVFLESPQRADLPRVHHYYDLELPRAQPLLELESGSPLIARIPSGNGDVFVCASPMDGSAGPWYRHAIMAPVLLNAALFQGRRPTPYIAAGAVDAYQFFPMGEKHEKPLVLRAGEREIIPPQRYQGGGVQLFLPQEALMPGSYPVYQEKQLQGHLSVNGDPRESELDYLSQADMLQSPAISQSSFYGSEEASSMAYAMNKRYQGHSLWPYFIVLALVLLALEIILLKYWRP